MSKKFEERNTTLTNQVNDFHKNQTQQPQRSSFSQNRGQNSNSTRGNNRGNYRSRLRGNNRGFRRPRPNYQRPQWHNQNQSSYTPRQQSYQNFPQQISNFFFSRNLPVSNLRIQTLKIKILKIKTHSLRNQIFNRNHRLKSLLQILITCLMHNKLRLLAIKVSIIITWRQIVQYARILRVVEHKIFLIRIQKTNYAAQASKAQLCKESPVEKARHI